MEKLKEYRTATVIMAVVLVSIPLFLILGSAWGGFQFSFLNIEYGASSDVLKGREAAVELMSHKLDERARALAMRERNLRFRMEEQERTRAKQTIKPEGPVLLERPFAFSNTGTGFSVYIEAEGTARVYENVVEVFIETGTLSRNPHYIESQPIIYITAVHMKLGAWTRGRQSWTSVFESFSHPLPIKQPLSDTIPHIPLDDLVFLLPLRPTDLANIEDRWLVMGTDIPSANSSTGTAHHYAHSDNNLFK